MEVFFLVVLLLCVVSISVDYPLVLGALLVPMISGTGFMISGISVFLGFVVFMVVVGGMLVVFAYAVALSPDVSFSVKSVKFPLSMVFSVFFLWWSSMGRHTLRMSTGESMFQVDDRLVFDLEWGMLSVWLCLLLFVMMIGVASVCAKASDQGAIVTGSVAVGVV